MKFDKYHTIEMEQCGAPGNTGDSMAETSRVAKISAIGPPPWHRPDLMAFVTERGFIRHPDSPWREDDMTSDQMVPFYLASRERFPNLKKLIESRLKAAGWRTGNGDLISPVFWSILKRKRTMTVFCLWTQAKLFKFPWRWSDSKKWFEKTEGSSGDYLNWFIIALLVPKEAKKYIKREVLWQKIQDYYKPEPNCEWVLDLYAVALQRFYEAM